MTVKQWWKTEKGLRHLRSLNRRGDSITPFVLRELVDNTFTETTASSNRQLVTLTNLLLHNSLTFQELKFKFMVVENLTLRRSFLNFLKNLNGLDWNKFTLPQLGSMSPNQVITIAQNVLRIIDKVMPKQLIEFKDNTIDWLAWLVGCLDDRTDY